MSAEKKRKNIYFSGSMRGGRDGADTTLYKRIVKYIESLDVDVPSKQFVAADHDVIKGHSETFTEKEDKDNHELDLQLIGEANAVIAEVTRPSLGVGYEIGRAVVMNKKILCLFRSRSSEDGKALSSMIRGAKNGDKFIVKDYKESEMEEIVKEFIGSL